MAAVQSDGSKPVFSLVVPTRNRPDLVIHCLTFISRQTYSDYEVILSDNGSSPLPREVYSKYSDDLKFKYVRPDHEMNMAEHWEFAVSFATGEYVTVLSEKFMLRPDALSILSELIQNCNPDIITWQFERFEADADDLTVGHYHPLMKPTVPKFYSPKDELKRRFGFETPVFSRTLRHKNSYGKLYSGCVRRDILEKVKFQFGRLFPPYNPDFTSMVGILNEAQTAIDVGQSLMIVVFADGYSTGDSTKTSLVSTVNFFKNYQESFNDFRNHTLFTDCWVGHNNIIAFDYHSLKSRSSNGPILEFEIDRVNLFSWMLRDLSFVQDFGSFSKAEIETTYKFHLDNFDIQQLEIIKSNLASLQNEQPCPYEIFHSGLQKLDYLPVDISPAQLACMHWIEGVAPPRKNVLLKGQGIESAIDFFYNYNLESIKLLNLSVKTIGIEE